MKIADIKPDTVYLVNRRPDHPQLDLGYAQTRKNIVPQVSNEQVYKKGAYGLTWGYDPVRKDRLSIRPVVLIDNEWVFDEEGSRHTRIAPIRGEWGQIQTRYILSEVDMGKIASNRQADKDLDRLTGYSCKGTKTDRIYAVQTQDSLAQEAFEFYADHLEQIRSSERVGYEHENHEKDLDDARILREFDNYKWLGKGYR